MKIGIVVGSNRAKAQSKRIGEALVAWIPTTGAAREADLLFAGDLPLWDEGKWKNEGWWGTHWPEQSARIASWDAAVFIAPEWNGMAPPTLMNVFLLIDGGELAHKPALIVGVSAGRSGSYPIVELRGFGYKNTRICHIPDHVIVRQAQDVNWDDLGKAGDDVDFTAMKTTYGMNVLFAYADALAAVRDSGVIDMKTHKNGM